MIFNILNRKLQILSSQHHYFIYNIHIKYKYLILKSKVINYFTNNSYIQLFFILLQLHLF